MTSEALIEILKPIEANMRKTSPQGASDLAEAIRLLSSRTYDMLGNKKKQKVFLSLIKAFLFSYNHRENLKNALAACFCDVGREMQLLYAIVMEDKKNTARLLSEFSSTVSETENISGHHLIKDYNQFFANYNIPSSTVNIKAYRALFSNTNQTATFQGTTFEIQVIIDKPYQSNRNVSMKLLTTTKTTEAQKHEIEKNQLLNIQAKCHPFNNQISAKVKSLAKKTKNDLFVAAAVERENFLLQLDRNIRSVLNDIENTDKYIKFVQIFCTHVACESNELTDSFEADGRVKALIARMKPYYAYILALKESEIAFLNNLIVEDQTAAFDHTDFYVAIKVIRDEHAALSFQRPRSKSLWENIKDGLSSFMRSILSFFSAKPASETLILSSAKHNARIEKRDTSSATSDDRKENININFQYCSRLKKKAEAKTKTPKKLPTQNYKINL